MSILFEINGIRYEGWEKVSIFRSMETLSSSFDFLSSAKSAANYPIKSGDQCAVFVDGTQVINGFVYLVGPDYNDAEHRIRNVGQDRTGDIVASSLKKNIELNNPITLKRVVERIVAKVGFSDMQVTDNVGSIKVFGEGELTSGSEGETAFSVIDRACKKRQVLCTNDGKGNILLERASTSRIPVVLSMTVGGQNNNIKSANSFYDETNRFSEVNIATQANTSTSDADSDDAVKIIATARDTEIRSTKKLTILSDSDLDRDSAKKRAEWEVNIRRARGFSYIATVAEFSYDANGSLWSPNKLVTVNDQFADIGSNLLIKSVRYMLDETTGSTTEIECTYPDAYTLQAQEDAVKKRHTNIGDDFR